MNSLKTYGLTLGLLGLLSAIACGDNDKLSADTDAGHDEDHHDEEDAGDEEDSDSGGPDESMDAGSSETEDGGADAGTPDASSDAGQISTAASELGADLVFDPNELEADLRLPAEAEFPQDLPPPK